MSKSADSKTWIGKKLFKQSINLVDSSLKRLIERKCQAFVENIPANTWTLKQRWNNVDRQRYFNVDFWLKMKVEPTYIYWRCSNVCKTASVQLRQFNVEESTLFQRRWISVVLNWYLVENESWAESCLSMMFQRWKINIETTLIELRRFSNDD